MPRTPTNTHAALLAKSNYSSIVPMLALALAPCMQVSNYLMTVAGSEAQVELCFYNGSGRSALAFSIGAFLLLTINRALPIVGIDDFWQRAVVGALIIGSIVLDRVLAVRQHRRLISQREGAR